jgi:hypothetical protein
VSRIFGSIAGGYHSPLVASLTPWQTTTIEQPEQRKDWPPYIDAERLVAYEAFTALIENRPWEVFDRLDLTAEQREKISLAVALPELLCNVWADAVWSDPPTIEFPTDALDTAWSQIDKANEWTEAGAWESVFDTAAYGHSIVRLRRDESRTARYGSPVVIEEIHPSIYFPTMKAGSSRQVESITLAWEEDRSAPDSDKVDPWQVREFHRIENGVYTITLQERRPRSSILGGETDFREIAREVTDLDFLPFVDMHAKRFVGRYWGMSEVGRNLSLFDEVDSNLSNIAEVLDYHGKPMLQTPADWLYGGSLTKGNDVAHGVRREELANVARYITYDGQLEPGLAELDKVIELIFLTSEVPRTYFGLGELGQSPSGTSLKLQLQNYVKKAGRWQAAETRRTRELAWMALRIAGVNVDVTTQEAKVTHGSPLPVDDEQEARIETALYTAGLTSKELAVRRLRRVPADEVDDELARIEDEEPEPPSMLPVPRIPGGVVNPNDPEPPADGNP